MNIHSFIQDIEKEFEDLAPGTLNASTEFRKLEGWSSMMALILIAKIDSDYNVAISAEELAQCKTMQDLFRLTQSKQP